MTVNEGEAFVAGLDAETAQRLLEAAEKAGLDPSVIRTSPDGGFVVPEALVDKPKPTRKTAEKPAADEQK